MDKYSEKSEAYFRGKKILSSEQLRAIRTGSKDKIQLMDGAVGSKTKGDAILKKIEALTE